MTRARRVAQERRKAEIEREVAALAAISPAGYAAARRPSAKRLDTPVAMLDRLVEAKSRENRATDSSNTAGKGRLLNVSDIEPWPAPVDGVPLLDALADKVRHHVVLDAAAADATALWIVHTHAIDAAYVTPRLAITSPQRRCGKTTLLILLSGLVARRGTSANLTVATLFRAIHAARPTLLIDEADTFLGDAEEIRGIINAGHCRGTATVWRTIETRDGHEVHEFDAWGAIALAAIGKLPGTIEDRSIKIAMRRRRPDETIERLRLDRLGELKPLAQHLARWAKDHLDALRAADPDVPAELHDRAADNWRPLLAIADEAGGDWPKRAREAAKLLTRDGAEDGETTGTMLLADIRAAFDEKKTDRLTSEKLVSHLLELDDRPWPELGKSRKPITKARLAVLLKPFKISPGTIRLGEGRNSPTAKGYYRSAFEDAFARYSLPDQTVTPSHTNQSAAFGEFQNVTPGNVVTDRNCENPSVSAGCDGVTIRDWIGQVNGDVRAEDSSPLRQPGEDPDGGAPAWDERP